MRTSPLRVVAHRGGSWPGLAGEQTVAHFERAVATGTMIEVDLRETVDGVLICHHDAEHEGVPVSELKADVLRRAGVPTLADLLQVVPPSVGLDLELKVAGIEARLVERIHADYDPAAVVYKSFADPVVRALKTADPSAFAGLLVGLGEPRHGALSRLREIFPGERALRCRADFVCAHQLLIPFGMAVRNRLLGLETWVWTVNEPAWMHRLVPHVDAIVTDLPLLALDIRRQRGRPG